MTEYESLLLMSDVHLKYDRRLNKMRYDISPYWTAHQFNENIIYLKKYMESINPLYINKRSFTDFLKHMGDLFDT